MPPRRVGRYLMFDAFASGGMASIHFGRLTGASGFARMVVLKRLHPQFAKDAEFVGMFTDEARVSARVQHPNVVGVHDVVKDGDELVLILDYVHGEPLSKLIRAAIDRDEPVPARIAAGIVAQALHGLHAAHEAKGEGGKPLGIVHRDVSPQNILVGVDGVARVVDFGVAKALGKSQHTAEGNMKGKIRYFAPEQLSNDVDRRTDVFAAGVVLWEALLGQRLFSGDTQWEIIQSVLSREIPSPAAEDPSVPEDVSAVVTKALTRERDERYPTARAMAIALEKTGVASTGEIAEWVEQLVGEDLDARRDEIAALEGLEDVAPPSMRGPRSLATPTNPPRSARPVRPDDREAERSATDAQVARTGVASATEPPRPASRVPWVGVLGAMLGVAGIAFGVGMALRPAAPPPASADAKPLPSPTAEPTAERAPEPSVEVRRSADVLAPPAPSTSVEPQPTSTAPRTNTTPPPTSPPTNRSGVACTGGGWGTCFGDEVCEAGFCKCWGKYCPADGVCHSLQRDRANCGACGRTCNENQVCESGTCFVCGTGYARCGNECLPEGTKCWR